MYGGAAYGQTAYGLEPASITSTSAALQAYFKFVSFAKAVSDPIMGQYNSVAVRPLWVYDLRLGGGLQDPGSWWLYILTPDQANSVLLHSSLQFIIDPAAGVIFSNLDQATTTSIEIETVQSGLSRPFRPTWPWSVS